MANTIIDGYAVTLDDGNVYVAHGRFSASLAALEETGRLEDGDGSVRLVTPTINKIIEWSARNGGPVDGE